jgi:hypothetical protein
MSEAFNINAARRLENIRLSTLLEASTCTPCSGLLLRVAGPSLAGYSSRKSKLF